MIVSTIFFWTIFLQQYFCCQYVWLGDASVCQQYLCQKYSCQQYLCQKYSCQQYFVNYYFPTIFLLPLCLVRWCVCLSTISVTRDKERAINKEEAETIFVLLVRWMGSIWYRVVFLTSGGIVKKTIKKIKYVKHRLGVSTLT